MGFGPAKTFFFSLKHLKNIYKITQFKKNLKN
jgi:hypothetical protein